MKVYVVVFLGYDVFDLIGVFKDSSKAIEKRNVDAKNKNISAIEWYSIIERDLI